MLPFGIDLEKVSGSENPRNLKEAQVTFAVAKPAVLITIGLGGVTILANNADWSEAPALIALVQTVLSNVLRATEAKLESHQAVVGFHIKPGPKPFGDVMKRFVDVGAISAEKPTMIGVGLYGPEYSLILDNSINVPGGLFVKITRVFPSATGFEEMASILWKDEENLLRTLGFRMES